MAGRCLVFTGQGSQKVGMAKDLLARWPSLVGPILDEAEAAMGLPLKRLMTEGPQTELTHTSVAQPAILTHSYAVLQILKHEAGLRVDDYDYALGHSLGQFSALVATDALRFADAVKLVHHRGKAMMQAMEGASDPGAMAALLPATAETADAVCARAQRETGLVCQVANYNSSKQVVISGNAAAVDAAVALAKEFRVRRAVRLDVSAPFHCALMQPAADMLARALEKVPLREPSIPVICNVTAETLAVEDMRARLSWQVVAPVKWSQSVDFCLNHNARTFLELGYGGVLTGLITQHAKEASCSYALSSAADPNGFCRSLGTVDEVETFIAAAK
ncbi:malonyl CoA-acyl carrier protein transacylase [Achlya hypogyna]|uniref:[acyl-carrier-protein] S-malonyltransferase n=1 Tax=Achlya hypogyna TaxID=1202772 RepID=A0A1V9Z0V7_ACHHY|nr:malonyl CoA-acyl carrier protein transacylase [Achlya hypogyna]